MVLEEANISIVLFDNGPIAEIKVESFPIIVELIFATVIFMVLALTFPYAVKERFDETFVEILEKFLFVMFM